MSDSNEIKVDDVVHFKLAKKPHMIVETVSMAGRGPNPPRVSLAVCKYLGADGVFHETTFHLAHLVRVDSADDDDDDYPVLPVLS